MEDAILNFGKQLSWVPEVVGQVNAADKFIVCGMGGSALAAGFLKANDPKLDLLIHRDYGLPRVPDYFLKESLIIISSYSGETEETIDVFNAAMAQGLNVAVVTTGGELLALAQEKNVPFIQLPTSNIQSRMALGYSLRALAKLMGVEIGVVNLDPASLQAQAEALAARIGHKIPLIYSGTALYPLAYSWKVNFNETSKSAAFANVLPEANHNEITGANDNLYCLMLSDSALDERVKRRFAVARTFYESRGVASEIIELAGNNSWEKLLNYFLLGAWTSVALAKNRGVDPETNPAIAEFKQLL